MIRRPNTPIKAIDITLSPLSIESKTEKTGAGINSQNLTFKYNENYYSKHVLLKTKTINVHHSSEISVIKNKSLHTLCSAIACYGYNCKEIENNRFRYMLHILIFFLKDTITEQ